MEKIRGGANIENRSWMPWLSWLSDNTPLTVSTGVDDRRKARVAILQQPKSVEERLKTGVTRMVQQEGKVIIVGAADDPECSGLIAETAHICANFGTGATIIFTPPVSDDRRPVDVLALSRELERMVIMGGENIVSDRNDPPVSARQLFDRIAVLEPECQNIQDASIPASEVIWNILAYEEVFKKLLPVQTISEKAVCCNVRVHGHAFPVSNLWDWVREETLARIINGQWLHLNVNQECFITSKEIEGIGKIKDIAQGDADAFWKTPDSERAPGLFLVRTFEMHQAQQFSQNLLMFQGHVPVDKDYYEQAEFCNRERINFTGYVEHWCHALLEKRQRTGYWSIPILMQSLIRIEDGFETILDRIQRLSGDSNLTDLINFVSLLYTDFLSIVSGFRQDTGKWVAKFIGAQPDINVEPPLDQTMPVAYDIENERKASREKLQPYFLNPNFKQFIDTAFTDWLEKYGSAFLEQVRFYVKYDTQSKRFHLKFYLFNREYDVSADVAQEMRAAMNRYENVVLNWQLHDHIEPETIPNPIEYFRVGKHSSRIFPSVQNVFDENDPFIAEALQIVQKPLSDALGMSMPPQGIPPYVWPEESNAKRIADKIRNILKREPAYFSPYAVHLMRNTEKLYRFMHDLASANVVAHRTQFKLIREGSEYMIGPHAPNLQGIDAFQNVIRQAVSLEISTDGKPIPYSSISWKISPEQAVVKVEKNPLVQKAMDSPQWSMWKDIIQGLTLEYGK